ncbi:hypothetical protein V3481_010699 [Fusarium oxysporum f. sp. vasinfectum]
MEDVFASAYCTIAASSACGWQDGFLKPNLDFLKMDDIPRTPHCACDFDKDVDEGPLLRRAWVLQERVLSRRIIHFAATHTYWECGEGVRCQRFTQLKPPPGRQFFILDPNFPHRLSQSGYRYTVDFVRFLFKKYSTSGLTFESDRPIAIYSLVQRMRQALRTEVRYGIVRCFLRPLLLWKRINEGKPVPFSYGDRTLPSWSWMAYPGGIDFISDTKQRLMVPCISDLDFAANEKSLNVKVRKMRQFENCQIEKKGGEHSILDGTKTIGSLWFDVASRSKFEHCVVVGMIADDKNEDPQKTYYVLVIQKKEDGEGYERIGVGKVEAQYVSRDCDAETLW